MLNKLLHYDLRAMFKYWWIAALSSFVLSLLGGSSLSILLSEREYPAVISAMLSMSLILVCFALTAFCLLASILIFARFYRNFFTDEGYLTFTLPLGTGKLLNAKLISAILVLFGTSFVIIADILTMLCFAFAEQIFTPDFGHELAEAIHSLFAWLGVYTVIYLIEGLVLLLLLTLFSLLFLFCCITIASIITKRAKVITAIGIYYGANSIFSFVMQMFYLFGITSLVSLIANFPEAVEKVTVALILLGLICSMSIFCCILYLLQYRMLDRKLNLP